MPGEISALRKESPVALLVLKLEKWMVQQPEWLLIVNMSRQERRAAMRELANRLYTIPAMDGVNTVPRAMRRKVTKQMASAAREQERKQQTEMREMLADALLREARASVALDGETQSMMLEQAASDENIRHDIEHPEGWNPGRPAEEVLAPYLDPEGDVKADIEAGKEAADDDDYPDIPLDR